MTKKKLEKEAGNWLRKYLLCCNCEKKCKCIDNNSYCEELVLKAYVDSAEAREKRIADLEEKISNLLSCKNCSENKGGFICQKEYEDKCLAQKIQYIKELQQENAELKSVERMALYSKMSDQLTKAKEIIKKMLAEFDRLDVLCNYQLRKEAEQFLDTLKEKESL